MSKPVDGCVKPSKGPILDEAPGDASPAAQPVKEKAKMTARVGKPAPDFELSAFFGEGFKNVRLSEYKGKWIVLCFYPGDFTFV